jgi:hypothetical protein
MILPLLLNTPTNGKKKPPPAPTPKAAWCSGPNEYKHESDCLIVSLVLIPTSSDEKDGPVEVNGKVIALIYVGRIAHDCERCITQPLDNETRDKLLFHVTVELPEGRLVEPSAKVSVREEPWNEKWEGTRSYQIEFDADHLPGSSKFVLEVFAGDEELVEVKRRFF